MNLDETELKLLEKLYLSQEDDSPLTQRELAGDTGLSLGMTNILLRRFAERGWITLTHLSGKKLRYALTARGMEEIARRSVSYFRRTIRGALLYRKRIESYVRHLSRKGYSALVFEGPAEIDFLFKSACEEVGIAFYANLSEADRKKLISLERTMVVVEGKQSEDDNGMPRTDDFTESDVDMVRLSDILFNDYA